MYGLDALELARLQFAFTVSFHIIFPALTIGLASYLAVLEALWIRTRRAAYMAVFNFWKKIFAIVTRRRQRVYVPTSAGFDLMLTPDDPHSFLRALKAEAD